MLVFDQPDNDASLFLMSDDFYCESVLSGRIPVHVVAESAGVLAFEHTNPAWQTHIVVIPKLHVRQLIEVQDPSLFAEMFTLMIGIIKDRGLAQTNFKIITNGGSYQSTQHLHFHLVSGQPLDPASPAQNGELAAGDFAALSFVGHYRSPGNQSRTSDPQPLPPDLSVRVMTPADAEAYRPMRLQALEEEPPAFGSLPSDEPELAETAARLAESKDRFFLGAFHDGQLVGSVRLSRYPGSTEKHRAYLAGFYVLPAFRRRGYGRALVREALTRARAAGDIRIVTLSVVAGNVEAIQLYQSFGFQFHGLEREAFCRDNRYYDEYLMTLVLISADE
jgi:RimJ/RimL family protein N-acetyltransferase/diadenosine tetraphosphate (Ap4A) HIT family hydrolase